ncbi:MAG: hypothetical protein ACO32I_07815, partial [Candidatus Limnocylindrus sp.]
MAKMLLETIDDEELRVHPDADRIVGGDEEYRDRLRRMLPKSMKRVVEQKLELVDKFTDPAPSITTRREDEEPPRRSRMLVDEDGEGHENDQREVHEERGEAQAPREREDEQRAPISPREQERQDDEARDARNTSLLEAMRDNNKALIDAMITMRDRPTQSETIKKLMKRDRTKFFACVAACLEGQYPDTVKAIQITVETEVKQFGPKWARLTQAIQSIYKFPLNALLDDWKRVLEKVGRFGTRTGSVEWGLLFRSAFPRHIFTDFAMHIHLEADNYDDHRLVYRKLRDWQEVQTSMQDVVMLTGKFGGIGSAGPDRPHRYARSPERRPERQPERRGRSRGRSQGASRPRRTHDSRRRMSRGGRDGRNPPIMAVKAGGRPGGGARCKACLATPPCKPGECRARNAECYACGKKGHLRGSELCSGQRAPSKGRSQRKVAMSPRGASKYRGQEKRKEKRPAGKVKRLAEVEADDARDGQGRGSSAPADSASDTECVFGVNWDGCALGDRVARGIKPFRHSLNYMRPHLEAAGYVDVPELEVAGEFGESDRPPTLDPADEQAQEEQLRQRDESARRYFNNKLGMHGGEVTVLKSSVRASREVALELDLKYLDPRASYLLTWSWEVTLFMAARLMGRFTDYTPGEYKRLLEGWLLPPPELQVRDGKHFMYKSCTEEIDCAYPPTVWPAEFRARCGSLYYMSSASMDQTWPDEGCWKAPERFLEYTCGGAREEVLASPELRRIYEGKAKKRWRDDLAQTRIVISDLRAWLRRHH